MFHDIIIVGGGATGIMSSILLRDKGYDVCIIESNDRIGKKILATGNGRCNITNNLLSNTSIVSDYYYTDYKKDFISNIFNKFSFYDTINFFESIGLSLTTLDDGKMYPLSLQASSVIDIFRFALEERSIPVYTSCKVKTITKQKNFYIETSNDEFKGFTCNKLVLCTGGNAMPSSGSDGFGYTLSKKLGHTVIKPLPALVQLKLDFNQLKAISGVKFDGIATLYNNNEKLISYDGELLFTDYGISGPPILQLSPVASRALNSKNKVTIKVDMMPSYNKAELEDFLENKYALFSHRSVATVFTGVINKKLIPVLLKNSGIDSIHKPAWDLSWKEKQSIISLLKEWEFEVTDTNSFNNAQSTLGGVNLSEINVDTLESKIVPNLYFGGELVDVCGFCGGFNLQWAWSCAGVIGNM